tara:strand:- start:251 stop:883 length:633 start_codon:yes stop_codon:yes gene_type:complete
MKKILGIVVRIFLSVFILIISFQSWTKADDIRDFEIEGMSIGDNLLEHHTTIGITKKKLKNFKLAYYPNSKKFAVLNISDTGNFKQYENVQFHVDPNNYQIHAISGRIISPFHNDLDKCIKKMEIVFNDLKSLFPNVEIFKGNKKAHVADKTGNSLTKKYYFTLSNGRIRIDCTDWSKDYRDSNGRKVRDNFMISLVSKELTHWINNEAY